MSKRTRPLLLLIFLLLSFCLRAQTIVTVAGNGFFSYSGDGGAATSAQLFFPNATAIDPSGNMYIADAFNNCIRKINTSGIISTIAGNGIAGYGGDGGAATNAKLYNPTDVITDGAGNIFVTDQLNNRVREINTSGIITTIAGGAAAGYFGDGGAATAALLNSPTSLSFDAAGNLYIADFNNNVIRKVNTSGVITRFAGNAASGYSGDGVAASSTRLANPSGVTVDGSGNVLIADQYNHRIRKVNTSGIISTVAGTGTPGYTGDGAAATLAQLNYPYSVKIDGSGNFFIADNNNNCIRKVNTSGIISTYAGNGIADFSGDGGVATLATMNLPAGITLDGSGNLYIADMLNYKIRKVTTAGIISTLAGGVTGSRPATACAINPQGALVDAGGNIFLSDADNNRICKITPSGVLTTIAGTGTMGYAGDGGPASAAILNFPTGVAMDAGGNMYIAELGNNLVRKISASGIISTIAGSSTFGFSGDGGPATAALLNEAAAVAVDASGNVYIADHGNNRVRKITASGLITTIAGGGPPSYIGDGGPATDAGLRGPTGVAVDLNGNVFIADPHNNRIRQVNTAGIINTVVGTGTPGFTGDGGAATNAQVNYPTDVRVDSSGNLYIADNGNNSYRKVNALGIITTMAGIGTGGFTGDGGPATGAQLNSPGQVAFDANGNVYISDYNNYRLRKVQTSSLPAIKGTLSICMGGSTTLSDATTGGTWTSSNTAVATVGSSSGIVTSIAAGTSTIIYAVGTNTVAKTLTVNPLPVAGLITGPSVVCVAASITLTDTITGGLWTRSNFTAGVSGGVVTGVSAGTNTISYTVTNVCGSATTTKTITVNPLPVAGTIVGTNSVCVGASVSLTDLTTGGAWSSSNTRATVAGGLVTGVSGGKDTISYSVTNSCGTVAATKTITVNPLPVVGAISGPSVVCVGASIALTDATTGGIWTAANTTASVTGGTVTGLSAGTNTISYYLINSCGSTIVTTTITVNPLPAAGTITGASVVCAGSAITLTDLAAGGVWTSTNSSATVSGGMVTGVYAGKDTISYSVTNSCGTAKATKTITVNPLPVAGTITGASSVCAGSAIVLTDATTGGTWSCTNTTAKVSGGVVTGMFAGLDTVVYSVTNSCGTAIAVQLVTINPPPSTISGTASACESLTTTLTDADAGGVWTSSNTAAATIGTSSGLVTGVSAGTSIITYAFSTGCLTTKIATINPLPFIYTVTGGGPFCIGDTGVHIGLSGSTTGISYQLYNGSTTVGTPLTGSGISLDYGLLTVAGTYTVVATNTSTACVNDMVGSATVTVNPLPGAITGITRLCVGDATSLSDGTTGGAWTTSSSTLVTVGSGTGIVSAVSAGKPTIIYTLTTGCKTSISLTVDPLPSVIKGPASLCTGLSITLSDAGGGTWTSSNTSVAPIVSTIGVLTGLTAGTVEVTYALATGCMTSTTVTVNPLPPTIAGFANVCVNATTGLSDGAPGGSWSVNDPSLATISSAGVVTGISRGSATITYTLPTGCITFCGIMVNPLPYAGTIIAPSEICIDSTILLTDTTSVSPGTWTSSNTFLKITSAGLATGKAKGTDTIMYRVNTVCGTDSTTLALDVVRCHLGVTSETGIDAALHVFPNPNEGTFSVLLSAPGDQAAVLTITNVIGQKVTELPIITNKQIVIAMDQHQPAGVYVITVVTATGNYVARITITR